MTTDTYMIGRKKYARPQALLLADNPGSIQNGIIVPDGTEFTDFIVLSDHNRQDISIDTQRLETRERTINGRMRSFHIADKLSITCGWDLLPSRAFANAPTFNTSGKTSQYAYTADGGAGGVDLLDWYENNKGSFWLYLSYDKYNNLNNERNRLSEYSQVVEVFFAGFDYSVQQRGLDSHDFWNISMTLEEV